jgi:hypothetical protein
VLASQRGCRLVKEAKSQSGDGGKRRSSLLKKKVRRPSRRRDACVPSLTSDCQTREAMRLGEESDSRAIGFDRETAEDFRASQRDRPLLLPSSYRWHSIEASLREA